MSLLELLTPYHISNLETLSAFLKSEEIPPPRFDIGSYASFIDLLEEKEIKRDSSFGWTQYFFEHQAEVYNHCGTTACAVGHGPLAGIPMLKGEEWGEYELRVFGVGQYKHQEAWGFMFSSFWDRDKLNNTAKGTAARIDYFLKQGDVPSEFSYYNVTEKVVWFEGLDTSTFIKEPA